MVPREQAPDGEANASEVRYEYVLPGTCNGGVILATPDPGIHIRLAGMPSGNGTRLASQWVILSTSQLSVRIS